MNRKPSTSMNVPMAKADPTFPSKSITRALALRAAGCDIATMLLYVIYAPTGGLPHRRCPVERAHTGSTAMGLRPPCTMTTGNAYRVERTNHVGGNLLVRRVCG